MSALLIRRRKRPLEIRKPPPDSGRRKRGKISGAGLHHTRDSAEREEGVAIMTKHPKMKKPSDADMRNNPLIGGSKGTTLAGATPDDLEDFQGANTLEGDLENDVNAAGGIDKSESRIGSRAKRG
jgi:hypothetical protein